MNFLTIDEVVANASTLIKNIEPKTRLLMKSWAYLGERRIGFSGLQINVEEVPVEDLIIRKPEYCAQPIDIALYDEQNNEYKYEFKGQGKPIHSGNRYKWGKIDVHETPFDFRLGSNGSMISRAKIKFYAYPVDDNGDLMFPEHHLEALMFYIKWMYDMREGDIQSARDSNMNFEISASKARSRNKSDRLLSKEVSKKWMSMIDKMSYYD